MTTRRKERALEKSAACDTICEAIASGDSLLKTLRRKGMPSYSTVMRWLADDDDQFRDNYARAREAQADADADRIGDIADRVLDGKLDPQAARVAIDALKWSAGKRQPKKYGDRLELDGKVGMMIEGVQVTFVEGDAAERPSDEQVRPNEMGSPRQ